MNEFFRKFSAKVSNMVGSAPAFFIAIMVIVVWAVTGPVFHFSDTWQLIINTGTTIVTFLMVFLIQNTQNREAKGMQLQLDELIKAVKGASNEMIELDEATDEELDKLKKKYLKMHESVEKRMANRGKTKK